ncbi:DNA-directed RNA polymerase I subunit rpa49, partial [Clydaea vesicula]
LEFVGNSQDYEPSCNYLVGIFDKEKNTVTLREAKVVPLATVVKKNKNTTNKILGEKNFDSRNELGEAFGSKKSKQQIKSRVQNKINQDSVDKVSNAIFDAVDTISATMPSREKILENTLSDRPIPPCNLAAETVKDVYNLENIAPQNLINMLSVKEFMHIKFQADLKKSIDKH